MAQVDCIAIGDLHLDALTKHFPGDLSYQLQYFEIEKALDYAISSGIKHAIFLGDVSEHWQLSQLGQQYLNRLLVQYDGRIQMYWILGNHDFAEDGRHSFLPIIELLPILKTTRIFTSPETVSIDGVKFNFSPYPHKKEVANAVNVGHFEVSGSTRDNGHKIKSAHNPKPKALWIMGHLHTPHTVGSVYYAGTLYQLNFGESLPKGFLRIQARMRNGVLQHKITRIKNTPRFQFFNLPVESKEDLRKIQNNPLFLYKLFVSSEYDLPLSVLDSFPNIVDHKGFSNKKELEAMMDDTVLDIGEDNIPVFDDQSFISEDFTRQGFSAAEIARAEELIQTAKQHIGQTTRKGARNAVQ